MGPSDRAGKKARAPNISTVPISKPTNSAPCVGNVPLVVATFFFEAKLPAAANSGNRNMKRPISIASPIVRLYQGVLVPIPPKALPLFPVPLT